MNNEKPGNSLANIKSSLQANPEISFRIANSKESLYFTFEGTLTEADAKNAVEKWKKMLGAKTTGIIHIWNCVKMKGYEPVARQIWQRTLKELKTKIETIWLISDSTLIIAGAKILSIFTSLDIKAVKSEAEIIY